MSGRAKMVIWVPHCISFSVSNKDLGTGVGNRILTQEQRMERSHINLLNVEQKKKNSLLQTLRRFLSFDLKRWKSKA